MIQAIKSISCFSAFLTLFLGINQALARDKAQVSVDWPGYYMGTAPCASCPGIVTWLYLDNDGAQPSFELLENYLEEKNGLFQSSGAIKWRKDGSKLQLLAKDDPKLIFVGKNFVELLGENEKPSSGKSKYILQKQYDYSGNGQQLLVHPKSVKVQTKGKNKEIRFDGVINFEHPTESGHKSLQASFIINCTKEEYSMPKVAYYSQRFATGKLIYKTDKNKNSTLSLQGDDDVLAQASADDWACGQ